MKLPSDETPDPTNGDGYLSDEYDQLEMMPAPIRDGDFSEYMWMEHEEEFNSQVLRELEEEELMEQCIDAMLDDEESEIQGNGTATASAPRSTSETTNSSSSVNGLSDSVNSMSINANGVRSNPPSDSTHNSNSTNRPARFTVQNRLSRGPVNGNASNVSEPKESTLNPDAKEFVPLSVNTTPSPATAASSATASENPNVPS